MPSDIDLRENLAAINRQQDRERTEQYTALVNRLEAVPPQIEREWERGLKEGIPNADEISNTRALQHNQTLDAMRAYFAAVPDQSGPAFPRNIDVQAMEERVWDRVNEFEKSRATPSRESTKELVPEMRMSL